MAKKDELQVERPIDFLKRERAFQRAGVIALTIFVAAGAAGVFGDGPLSRASTASGDTHLSYERFARSTTPAILSITVQTIAPNGEPIHVRLEREFLRRLIDLEVRPPDALRSFEDTWAVFELNASAGRAHLELHYKPIHFGVLRTRVMTDAGDSARMWQLIYF